MRADAARNRQALIDAAQRLFSERGLSVTLDDIAAEAGVNVATAYRHFANKHELAAAFLQQIITDAIAIAEQAAAQDDPWQGITEFLGRTLDLMTANRGLHDVFTPGYADEWLDRLSARIDPLLVDLIGRAQRAGAVRKDLAPQDLGVVLQMLAAVTDVPVADQPALLQRYLALILSGLRPSDGVLPGAPPTSAEVLAAASTPVSRRTPRRTPSAARGSPDR